MRSQAAFFFKKEDYGFSMHFSTKELTDENLEQQKWHMLPFKEDFRETVRMCGRLPMSALKKKL